jgi:anti-sigma factor (TIGR02949 family)
MDDCESMDCRKIREELVFLFADNEMGQELLVAFERHVSACPHCAREARYTRRLLTVVRERAVRWRAPRRLRARILARMPHRRNDIIIR